MGEYIFQLKSVHFVTPTRTVQYFNIDDVILIGEDCLFIQADVEDVKNLEDP